MIAAIQTFIDRTTMYRLVLYYLVALFVAAVALSALGVLPYAPSMLLWSVVALLIAGWVTNELFAWAFAAVTNVESVYITSFILVLILPPAAFSDLAATAALALASAWAMASKYIFALGKKHLFNPAALAAVLSGYFLGVSATWWVAGNLPLLPFILLGGAAVAYKLKKSDAILAFFAVALVAAALTAAAPAAGIQALLLHSALFFFAFVMLTEPLTMPPTRPWRVAYGILTGLLFIPSAHVGSLYFTPELALLVGNLFSFAVSPRGRYMLTLRARRSIAEGVYEYIFTPDKELHFAAGQYLEWTLPAESPDARGNRRYFTIASAPGEPEVALGIRFYEKPSAFKQTLARLPEGGVVSAASLAGDFTMPKDARRKLAFLAGGIGVTPFVSMARHLLKSGESRDAVLLYSTKTEGEIAYREVFTAASARGMRTEYVVGDRIDAERLARLVPDYRERLFYISGPHPMVEAMRSLLRSLGVSRFNIKTDFFPGLV